MPTALGEERFIIFAANARIAFEFAQANKGEYRLYICDAAINQKQKYHQKQYMKLSKRMCCRIIFVLVLAISVNCKHEIQLLKINPNVKNLDYLNYKSEENIFYGMFPSNAKIIYGIYGLQGEAIYIDSIGSCSCYFFNDTIQIIQKRNSGLGEIYLETIIVAQKPSSKIYTAIDVMKSEEIYSTKTKLIELNRIPNSVGDTIIGKIKLEDLVGLDPAQLDKGSTWRAEGQFQCIIEKRQNGLELQSIEYIKKGFQKKQIKLPQENK